jgi:hypothetical protein
VIAAQQIGDRDGLRHVDVGVVVVVNASTSTTAWEREGQVVTGRSGVGREG